MNKILLTSGKISIYLIWILFFEKSFTVNTKFNTSVLIIFLFLYMSMLLIFISALNLGKSFSINIPKKEIKLKNKGLYKKSRNPIYLSFMLFTLMCLIFISNLKLWILGVYGAVIHHLLVLDEEKFLEKTFGIKYIKYKKEVRRYF